MYRYLLTVCISNAHEKNVQFIMVLGKNENKNFQNVKLLGLNLCVSNGKAAGLKLQVWQNFRATDLQLGKSVN